MAGVTGRDGITATISSNTGITADRMIQVVDSNNPDATATNCASPNTNVNCNTVSLGGYQIVPFDTGAVTTTLSVDAGQTVTGHPSADLKLSWDNVKLVLQDMRIAPDTTATTKSIGTWAMTGSGSLTLDGDNGLFNGASGNDNGYLSLNAGNVIFNNDPNNINGTSTWSVGGSGGNRNAIFYSQTSSALGGYPELAFTEFGFLFDAPKATIGINKTNGLDISAPQAAFNLTFNLLFDPNGSSHFDYLSTPGGMLTDIPVINYGWRGHINNVEVSLATGGLPTSPSANLLTSTLTEGLHLSVAFDSYANDFINILGEPIDNGSVYFGSWKGIYNPDDPASSLTDPDHQPQFNMPYVGADLVRAGQGAGPLCFGSSATGISGSGTCSGNNAYLKGSTGLGLGSTGIPVQSINISPSGPGYASIIRDFSVHSFSNSVAIFDPQNTSYDPTTHLSQNYGWGLILSFGNTDANMYIYPDNPDSGDTTKGGITADLVATSQANGTDFAHRFYTGNNLMIADTDKNLGIGLLGADLLFATHNTTINLQQPCLTSGGCTGDHGMHLAQGEQGGLALASDGGTRYQLRAFLGGGSLAGYRNGTQVCGGGTNCDPANYDVVGLPTPQFISYYNLNLEADKLQLVIEPPSGFVGAAMPDAVTGLSTGNANYKNQSYLGYHGYIHLANLNDSTDPTTKSLSNTSGDAYAITLDTADSTFAAQQAKGFGSFLSLAEPHADALNVDFRLANVTGSIQIENGRLDLVSGAAINNTAFSQPSSANPYACTGTACDGNVNSHRVPQLAISQDIKVGATATDPFTGAAGTPLQIGHTYFGEQDLGSIIIPSGTMHTYFALKPMQ